MDLNKIKYHPDRYYIRLDGFDLNNLSTFAEDATFSQQQAIYIHEYYHYLTNITTFFGVRQFNLVFQDKVRLLSNLLAKAGLDAFPINSNNRIDCKYEIDYWRDIDKIVELDDLDDVFAEKVKNSPNKKFSIVRYRKNSLDISVEVRGRQYHGKHTYYTFDISGVPMASHFNLSDGMIDEFLSRSIDEYLFQHDLANNCEILRAQDFYPYEVFDELLQYFGFKYVDSRLKIYIAYFCLHAVNPIDCLIKTLRAIKIKGFERFESAPEDFLNKLRDGNELKLYAVMLKGESEYIEECLKGGRRNLADTMTLIYQKQYTAYIHLSKDFFYFIRPFLVDGIDTEDGRKEFLNLFKEIRNEMDEPILVQDGVMHDADSDTYKNHLAMHVAAYEIFDSLTVNRIAKRLQNRKQKYEYPKTSLDNDLIENFPDTPPLTETWHVALNDLSLYKLYLQEKNS